MNRLPTKLLSSLFLFLTLTCQAQLPIVPPALIIASHVGTDPGPPDEGWNMDGLSVSVLASTSTSHNLGITGGGANAAMFTNAAIACSTSSFYATNQGSATVGWTFSDDATLGAGSGVSFTFTCWYKTFPGQPNTVNAVLGKWDYTSQTKQDYILDVGGNHGDSLRWTCNNLAKNGYGALTWSPTPTTNAWHFVCVGYDDSQQKVYMSVDGATLQTASCVGVARTATAFECWNYAVSGSQGMWSGQLDCVYLWKKAFTQGNVDFMYNAGTGSCK